MTNEKVDTDDALYIVNFNSDSELVLRSTVVDSMFDQDTLWFYDGHNIDAAPLSKEAAAAAAIRYLNKHNTFKGKRFRIDPNNISVMTYEPGKSFWYVHCQFLDDRINFDHIYIAVLMNGSVVELENVSGWELPDLP